MSELKTAKQIAKLFQVRPETVKSWARSGRIPSLKPSPRIVRFDADAVSAALKRPEVQRVSAR